MSAAPDAQPALTPIDQEVSDALTAKLRESGVAEGAIAAVVAGFQAPRTPSADALLQLLRAEHEDPETTQ